MKRKNVLLQGITMGGISLLCLFPSNTKAENLLAFPGAEGFGRYATGGRGGSVYHVTNLNDAGPGSLRDAVSQPDRIIVFDVSGTIELKSTLIFAKNLTVLGQTAPGEGVQVYGNRVSFSAADNIIVRYMRFRMGVNGDSGKDAAGIASGENMIFDHLSVLWGRDENFSVNWDGKGKEPTNITIQNSIIGQGLQSHSCGGLIQTNGGVTLYRNLYIENKTRNPKVKGLNQFVNNVVYNWGDGGCYIMGDTQANSWAHIENNYFIKGPWQGATSVFTRGTTTFSYYDGAGNYADLNRDGILNGTLLQESDYSGSTPVRDFESWDQSQSRPQNHPRITGMKSAPQALSWIVDSVGPTLPARDEVDKYLIDELNSYGTQGTTNGISSEKPLPHQGTGNLFGGYSPSDKDGDGIPDFWETANGLDPDNASDAVMIASNGYMHIENYSFSIRQAHPFIKNPTALSIPSKTTAEITLEWIDNSNDETGFHIEQSTDGIHFDQLDIAIGANETTVTIEGLEKETEYHFRIRSFNQTLKSVYSNTVSAKTNGIATLPLVTKNTSPADGSKIGVLNQPLFSWKNESDLYGGEVRYTFLLGKESGNLDSIATLTTMEYILNTPLCIGNTYFWRIDATNRLGTTQGEEWSFSVQPGGIYFQTDFFYQPDEFYSKYGSTTTNLVNAKHTTKEVGGMIFGTGENIVRIAYIDQKAPTETSADYGPYSKDDIGATRGCVQFVTAATGGYILMPELNRPSTITLFVGNPETSEKEFGLWVIDEQGERPVKTFHMAGAKRTFKYEYTYDSTIPYRFKIDANGKKLNFNDISIASFDANEVPQQLQVLTSSDLEQVDYATGMISLLFNQPIEYHGGISISGNQYEEVEAYSTGSRLLVNCKNLKANYKYKLLFPEGSVSDITQTKTLSEQILFTTCDYPELKTAGETHFGKAALGMPLHFAPFNEVAPFNTTGGLMQSSLADYPHWISASGGVTAQSATLTATKDKIMGYYDETAGNIYLDIQTAGEGTVTLRLQETTNPDKSPGWRTLCDLTQADFPVKGYFELDPRSRFFKIAPVSISGIKVIANAISLHNKATSLEKSDTDTPKISMTQGGQIILSNLMRDREISITDLTGRVIYRDETQRQEVIIKAPEGFLIVRIKYQNESFTKKILVP